MALGWGELRERCAQKSEGNGRMFNCQKNLTGALTRAPTPAHPDCPGEAVEEPTQDSDNTALQRQNYNKRHLKVLLRLPVQLTAQRASAASECFEKIVSSWKSLL